MITLAFALPLAFVPQTCETSRLADPIGGPTDSFGVFIEADGPRMLISGHDPKVSDFSGSFTALASFNFFELGPSGLWSNTVKRYDGEPGGGFQLHAALAAGAGYGAATMESTQTITVFPLASPQSFGPTPILPPLPLGSSRSIRDLHLLPGQLWVLADETDVSLRRAWVHRFTIPGAQLIDSTQVGPAEIVGGPGDVVLAGSLEMLGNRMIVGLPGEDGQSGFDRGTVRVLEPQGSGLVETQQVLPPSPQGGLRFGTKLAAQGNRLLIAAAGSGNDGARPAAAYMYDDLTGSVALQQILDLGSATDGSQISVALDDDFAVVGTPGLASAQPAFSGGVRVFRETAGTWIPDPLLTALVPESFDGFGTSVEILVDGQLAIGATRDPLQSSDRGVVGLFDLSGQACATTLAAPIQQGVFFLQNENSGLHVDLAIDGGAALAGELAIVLTSATAPGGGIVVDGLTIPILPDALTLAALGSPASVGLSNSVVQLNGSGRSEVPLLSSPVPPLSLSGIDLYFTWISIGFETGGIPFVQGAGDAERVYIQ